MTVVGTGKRVAVVGSRHGVNRDDVVRFVRNLAAKHPDATVLSGRASGVDRWAEAEANEQGLTFEPFPADWNGGDKLAGKRRNWQMAATRPDEWVAFWDGWSNGTAHGVTAATFHGCRVWVFAPEDLR